MATDLTPVANVGEDVMAAIDDAGPGSRFIIADVSRDDAWLSMCEMDAPSLPAWR